MSRHDSIFSFYDLSVESKIRLHEISNAKHWDLFISTSVSGRSTNMIISYIDKDHHVVDSVKEYVVGSVDELPKIPISTLVLIYIKRFLHKVF